MKTNIKFLDGSDIKIREDGTTYYGNIANEILHKLIQTKKNWNREDIIRIAKENGGIVTKI